MTKQTFEIMYQALVEIASADTFFDSEKKLAKIAKDALQKIGKISDTPTP